MNVLAESEMAWSVSSASGGVEDCGAEVQEGRPAEEAWLEPTMAIRSAVLSGSRGMLCLLPLPLPKMGRPEPGGGGEHGCQTFFKCQEKGKINQI